MADGAAIAEQQKASILQTSEPPQILVPLPDIGRQVGHRGPAGEISFQAGEDELDSDRNSNHTRNILDRVSRTGGLAAWGDENVVQQATIAYSEKHQIPEDQRHILQQNVDRRIGQWRVAIDTVNALNTQIQQSGEIIGDIDKAAGEMLTRYESEEQLMVMPRHRERVKREIVASVKRRQQEIEAERNTPQEAPSVALPVDTSASVTEPRESAPVPTTASAAEEPLQQEPPRATEPPLIQPTQTEHHALPLTQEQLRLCDTTLRRIVHTHPNDLTALVVDEELYHEEVQNLQNLDMATRLRMRQDIRNRIQNRYPQTVLPRLTNDQIFHHDALVRQFALAHREQPPTFLAIRTAVDAYAAQHPQIHTDGARAVIIRNILDGVHRYTIDSSLPPQTEPVTIEEAAPTTQVAPAEETPNVQQTSEEPTALTETSTPEITEQPVTVPLPELTLEQTRFTDQLVQRITLTHPGIPTAAIIDTEMTALATPEQQEMITQTRDQIRQVVQHRIQERNDQRQHPESQPQTQPAVEHMTALSVPTAPPSSELPPENVQTQPETMILQRIFNTTQGTPSEEVIQREIEGYITQRLPTADEATRERIRAKVRRRIQERNQRREVPEPEPPPLTEEQIHFTDRIFQRIGNTIQTPTEENIATEVQAYLAAHQPDADAATHQRIAHAVQQRMQERAAARVTQSDQIASEDHDQPQPTELVPTAPPPPELPPENVQTQPETMILQRIFNTTQGTPTRETIEGAIEDYFTHRLPTADEATRVRIREEVRRRVQERNQRGEVQQEVPPPLTKEQGYLSDMIVQRIGNTIQEPTEENIVTEVHTYLTTHLPGADDATEQRIRQDVERRIQARTVAASARKEQTGSRFSVWGTVKKILKI